MSLMLFLKASAFYSSGSSLLAFVRKKSYEFVVLVTYVHVVLFYN